MVELRTCAFGKPYILWGELVDHLEKSCKILTSLMRWSHGGCDWQRWQNQVLLGTNWRAVDCLCLSISPAERLQRAKAHKNLWQWTVHKVRGVGRAGTGGSRESCLAEWQNFFSEEESARWQAQCDELEWFLPISGEQRKKTSCWHILKVLLIYKITFGFQPCLW